jgi:hypothetical protein
MATKTACAVVAGMALLAALGAFAADPAPAADPAAAAAEPAPLQWQFSYKGPRVTARGVVSTAAVPEPDGSYRILSITGKRNGRRITELVPAGEMVTAHTFLFSDNRLLPASPFIGEGGFSFRTSKSEYFNVCHAGDEGFCGRKGYREYDGKRGGRPIQLELTRIPIEPPQAAPQERVAGDSG